MRRVLFIVIAFVLVSCGNNTIQISNLSDTDVGKYAAEELNKYLNQAYTGVTFIAGDENANSNIQFLLTEQARDLVTESLPTREESFKIIQKDEKLYIIAPDERGLLNATYALLEKLGCGFYISGDVVPKSEKWAGFEAWEMEDEPLTGDRFLLNWHNFLSGCSGWNLEDWQKWINQANKMRYNGIMVHAYGNNPMFSFEYLDEKKQTGYLNNTSSGRDWGNPHVNDVRRMVGGELFDAPVFGALPSFATEENKEKEVTELMQQVFQYAEDRGTKVIFALDFDTWMATPRNIVEKLPREAVFELIGGHIAPNPDHPEGYKYYKQVLASLIEKYPQIDQLSVWHRGPGSDGFHGSIWMSFPYEKFPEDWKKEYKQKLRDNTELKDNVTATSTFAYGKLIAAIQKARDELKPELEISSGSWFFSWLPYADAMYPENAPIIALDWSVHFDKKETQSIIAAAGKNREVYPVVWAHHDDHRYIGRPYTPWENLSDKLEKSNSSGFGIIHWTTHPLDLYFTSSARQVWKATKNEALQRTVKNYVVTRFGENDGLEDYYMDWLTKGPMFGRETSSHFVDLGKQLLGNKLESWAVMEDKTKKRLELLSDIPMFEENTYLKYQKAMEEFYLSFFRSQQLFEQAFDLAMNNEVAKAKEAMQKANPDEAIRKFIDATGLIGFSRGEKALVFSMNTRWKTDFINLRQYLGMEPVRFNFSPTQHDPLAAYAGEYTFFIDSDSNYWYGLGNKELNTAQVFSEKSVLENIKDSYLLLDNEMQIPLKMRVFDIPTGNYEFLIHTDIDEDKHDFECFYEDENQQLIPLSLSRDSGILSGSFENKGNNPKLLVRTSMPVKIYALELNYGKI